jgi:ribonuclease HI
VRPNDRISTLKWPRQPRPSSAAWVIWKNFLHHFHTNGKLLTPLGSWINTIHQSWCTFELVGANIVFRHHPTPNTQGRHLRSSRMWFSTDIFQETAELPHDVVPTTFIHHKDNPSLFYSRPSRSVYHPQVHTFPPSLWDQSNTPIFLEGSDAFYQYLLGPPQKSAFNMAQIAFAISAGTLLACSDGSFNPRSGTGSHGWVMATPNREVISSPYRAELNGLVATLYLIHRICSHHGVENGQCQIYCDNNGAIRNVFHHTFSGISQFTKSDYDLIQAAKHLLKVIPIKIKPHWVKGHSQAPKKTGTGRNEYNSRQTPNSYQIARPNYKIRLRYQNMVITS